MNHAVNQIDECMYKRFCFASGANNVLLRLYTSICPQNDRRPLLELPVNRLNTTISLWFSFSFNVNDLANMILYSMICLFEFKIKKDGISKIACKLNLSPHIWRVELIWALKIKYYEKQVTWAKHSILVKKCSILCEVTFHFSKKLKISLSF